MAILKDTTYCSTGHLRTFLTILFTAFALRLASAQPLSVSPASFDLGRFPAWKAQAQAFAVRNIGESKVNLLRVRLSCGCLAADFRPSALEAGQETDAPGQEFLRLAVSGGAKPHWHCRSTAPSIWCSGMGGHGTHLPAESMPFHLSSTQVQHAI